MNTVLLQFVRGFVFIAGVLLIAFVFTYLPILLGKIVDRKPHLDSNGNKLHQAMKLNANEQEREKIRGKEGEATYNQIYF